MSEPKYPSGVTVGDASTGSEASPAGAVPVKGSGRRTAPSREGLRLIALDATDLAVISAHLQDAVCRVRDMAFVPKDERFALLLNRFDWMKLPADNAVLSAGEKPTSMERRRCALRFEHVRSAKVTGFLQSDKKLVLSLLAIGFEQAREGDPDGYLTLLFSGGGAIRLDVECIEAELVDIGAGWRTKSKPEHPEF